MLSLCDSYMQHQYLLSYKSIQSIKIIVTNTKDIIHRLSVLGAKYHAVHNELSNKYPIDQLRDVRSNVFRHCAIVIDSTSIILLIRLDHPYDDPWWANLVERKLLSMHMTHMTEEQLRIFIGAFDTFVDSSYIIMLFVSVESAFRSFYSPVFSKEVPSEIYIVFKELLEEFNLERYSNLLKLFRLIRNSYHNNGKYTSNDAEVSWRDKTYEFRKGQQVEVGDVWQTFISITEDILEMLKELVMSDAILQKTEIIDISYNNLS
jgi:hypothetical protein